MEHPARLSRNLSINGLNSSSHHSSSTFTVDSYDRLYSQGLISGGNWLYPSQAACQHTSDYQTPTSSNLRPASSHEHSNDEDSHDPSEDSAMGTMENHTESSLGKLQTFPTQGYFRTTKLPQHLKSRKFGNFSDKLQSHPGFRSEPVNVEQPKPAKILRIWKWEVFNCVLATGIVGSMYGILLHYDDKPIPNWGTAINLSTLVALMATIFRTMLAYVVSEIIGQAKWNHFIGGGRPEDTAPVRRLIETSRFHDASQGLLGAFKLIPTIIRDPATLIAVMVMIVSLGTGSSVQQAIQTRSCQFAAGSIHASLPISRNITVDDILNYSGLMTQPNMFAVLFSALSPESEEIGSPTPVECSTGNCTFDNPIDGLYNTLGVCSSCADTSPLITSTGWKLIGNFDPRITHGPETRSASDVSAGFFTANYSLPNGMFVNATFENNTSFMSSKLSASADPDLGLEWAGDLVSLEMKALSRWALTNITILTSGWPPTSSGLTNHVAATCTLYPCRRSYKASVTSGELDEVLVRTIPAAPNIADLISPRGTIEDIETVWQKIQWHSVSREISEDTYSIYEGGLSLQAIRSPCLVNDTIWTRENKSPTLDLQDILLLHADADLSGGRRFSIENTTVPTECIYSMDMMVWSEFLGFEMRYELFNGTCEATTILGGTGTGGWMLCDGVDWLGKFYNDEGTTAASVIKRIEAFADRLSNKMRMGFLNTPETVSGQLLQMTVCSRIQYSWLAFPAVLVAVTIVLLAWTMFQSSRRRGRVKVWKTSILPFLLYGEQFVVQNGEDMSGDSLGRQEGSREPLLDLEQMEAEARQRKVRFDVFN